MLPNGFRQGFQLLLVKILPGLIRVGFHPVQGQQPVGAFFPLRLHVVPQQCPQALAKSFLRCHFVTPYPFSFRSVSWASSR